MAEEYTVSDSKTGKPEHYQDQDVIETSVNTDGRNQYDWESRYPENARKEMKSEAIYIGIILFVSFVLLICIWCGLIGRIGGHIGLESKIVTSLETSLDKGTQRKTTENELPSLTQCTA